LWKHQQTEKRGFTISVLAFYGNFWPSNDNRMVQFSGIHLEIHCRKVKPNINTYYEL
jgi:hypothetical protein